MLTSFFDFTNVITPATKLRKLKAFEPPRTPFMFWHVRFFLPCLMCITGKSLRLTSWWTSSSSISMYLASYSSWIRCNSGVKDVTSKSSNTPSEDIFQNPEFEVSNGDSFTSRYLEFLSTKNNFFQKSPILQNFSTFSLTFVYNLQSIFVCHKLSTFLVQKDFWDRDKLSSPSY